VGVKAPVSPTTYTETGMRFSDGSMADADAIIWCTGFADKNARDIAVETFGAGDPPAADVNGDEGGEAGHDVLGPEDIAARMDATWSLDAEGELRGVWKRHLRLPDFWIVGGILNHHRYFSKFVALQIKADLEGVLPQAYRETPGGHS
jgi:hypothetical protein